MILFKLKALECSIPEDDPEFADRLAAVQGLLELLQDVDLQAETFLDSDRLKIQRLLAFINDGPLTAIQENLLKELMG